MVADVAVLVGSFTIGVVVESELRSEAIENIIVSRAKHLFVVPIIMPITIANGKRIVLCMSLIDEVGLASSQMRQN